MNLHASALISLLTSKMDRSEEREFYTGDSSLKITSMLLPYSGITCNGVVIATRLRINAHLDTGITIIRNPTISERFWGRLRHPSTGRKETKMPNVSFKETLHFLNRLITRYPQGFVEIYYTFKNTQGNEEHRCGWINLSDLF